MEAIGAAATVVQLVSFTGEVLVLGYGYLARVKRAPSEIRALLGETATLNVLLDQLQDIASSSMKAETLSTLGRLGVFEDCGRLMGVMERGLRACEKVDGEGFKNAGKMMMWPFKEKEMKDLMGQLGRLREVLSTAVVVDSARGLRELEQMAGRVERGVVATLNEISGIKSTITATAEDMASVKSSLEASIQEEDQVSIRKWLHPDGVESEAHFKAALKRKHPDTGKWLLESEDFASWVLGHRNCLWLYGIAGCGKTILSATVVEYLESKSSLTCGTLYFFCDHRDPGKQSFQDLLHVIVKQLLDRDLISFTAVNSWRDEKNPSLKRRPKSLLQPLTISEYIRLIRFVCRQWQTVSLVVDAIDECSELDTLVDGIDRLTEDSNIKLLVTSRHEIELIRAISPLADCKIAVSEHMEEDIQIYLASEVQSRIYRKLLKFRQSGLDVLIVEALKKNADGMILIAKLQLDYICGLKSDRAIKEALIKLPSGIYPTYDEILRQLCTKRPGGIDDMKLILHWLQNSIVPLTLQQIAEIISIRDGDRALDKSGIATDPMDLVASLGSLVSLYTQDTSKTLYEDLRGPYLTFITLAHYSVEEYLRSGEMDPSLATIFHSNPETIHHDLAKYCLQYIGLEDFSIPIQEPSNVDHAYTASEAEQALIAGFDGHSPFKLDTTHLTHPSTYFEPVVPLFGDEGSVSRYFMHNQRRFLRKRTYNYAFYDYACRYWADHLRQSKSAQNLEDETKRLLAWFLAPSNSQGTYVSWQQMYHHDIVYFSPGRPPLYYAIEMHVDCLVSILLPIAEDVNSIACDVALLHVAARCGALKTVQKLVDIGASVDVRSSKDPKGTTAMMTPLHFAAEGGHPEVIQLLLDHGASPHIKNQSGSTAFSRAARSGSLRSLKVLYDAGSDINAQKAGMSPLYEAVAQCRPRVACQLLHWGADPTIVTYQHDSAVRFLQRARIAVQTKADSCSNSHGNDEKDWKHLRCKGITEGHIYDQILAIRAQGKGPQAFMPLMEGLKRESFLLKQMEKDTRPGTEREKDYRYPADPTKIITNSEFHDRKNEPFFL